MNLVLANVDYRLHTSTEGNELQEGLRHAGWTLSGSGYDGLTHVGEILARYQPDRVFIQDCRDWMPESNISFRKDIGFERLDLLGASGIPALSIMKDSWGWAKEQNGLARAAQLRGFACYYRTEMVRQTAPWIEPYALFRIHHSVDADLIRRLLRDRSERRDALVSGANQGCYPLRRAAFKHAAELGLDTIKHPGYGNRGADTPNYLSNVCRYKVHLATASQWSCSFRKIIESVACGVTPITNLTATDVLPEIDRALVRIPSDISLGELKGVIRTAAAAWDMEERMYYAEKALAYYDWRVSGERLSNLIEKSCLQTVQS